MFSSVAERGCLRTFRPVGSDFWKFICGCSQLGAWLAPITIPRPALKRLAPLKIGINFWKDLNIRGANDQLHRTPTCGRVCDMPIEAKPENIPIAMAFFEDNGWTKEQAAGIVGNLMHESGLNPDQHQLNDGPAYGLAQWENPRKRDLFRFAEKTGKPESDLDTQLQFIQHELNTSEAAAARRLRAAQVVDEATTVFCVWYERPSKPHLASRLGYARKIYNGEIT